MAVFGLLVGCLVAACSPGEGDSGSDETSASTSTTFAIVRVDPELSLVAVVICSPERISLGFEAIVDVIESAPEATRVLGALIVSSQVIHVGAADEEAGAEAFEAIRESFEAALVSPGCYIE